MNGEATLATISWLLIIFAFVNAYFVYHGGKLYFEVYPRSPVLLALWWVKTAIWLFNVFFATVAIRYLRDIEPVLPFGGLGLGLVVLFVLSVPYIVHRQMQRFVRGDITRNAARDAARDLGRDEVRDEVRDLAHDTERDRHVE